MAEDAKLWAALAGVSSLVVGALMVAGFIWWCRKFDTETEG